METTDTTNMKETTVETTDTANMKKKKKKKKTTAEIKQIWKTLQLKQLIPQI